MSASDRQGGSFTSIIVSAFIGSVAVGGFVVFAHYEAVRPGGSSALLFLSHFFTAFPLLVCLFGAPVAAVFCFWRRSRRTATAVLLSCLIVFGIILSSIRTGNRLRHDAFVSLAERSVVLVDAINSYEKSYGGPPASLSALVPEFISAVPQTGMGAYPDYEYIADRGSMYDENPWVLIIHTSTGILDFDQFIYYPLHNYPACWCGNRLERIRDWAYLHE